MLSWRQSTAHDVWIRPNCTNQRGTGDASPSGGGGLGSLVGGLLGGGGGAQGGLWSMLDMNRDGNPLDDILRMGGKTGR